MKNRGQWGTRTGFILAAIGSAIGLGNIWRFPYTVASNGGGAFLIPYFVALLTAGIPLMILEFGLGHKLRTSAPGIFGRLNKKWEWIGWWQCAISFCITVYYVVIVAWAVSYFTHSFDLSWGDATQDFFLSTYLGITDSPFNFGGFQLNILIPLILVWGINYIVLAGGVKGGIEKANKIFMPLLIVSILIITVRGITLPGAMDGLNYLFTPDFSKILNGRVWVAAYGQIFFTLSICFAIMLTYSSYLPKKSDIVNNAFITALGNCSFSLLAGISVFSILGHMAYAQGVPVQDVSAGGIGLAFIVFPQAINALPGANSIFGALFFLCLVFAGLSSSMSIIEAFVSALSDKFNISRKKALTSSCLIGFVVSLILVTGAGLYIIDMVDHFIMSYGVALAGLVEAILLAWFFNLEYVRNHVNPISDFKIGKWWNVSVKFTSILLGIMIILNIYEDFTNPYEGYSLSALITYGLCVAIFAVITGVIVSKLKGSKEFNDNISKGFEDNLSKGVENNEC